jgi:hypothetical protein
VVIVFIAAGTAHHATASKVRDQSMRTVHDALQRIGPIEWTSGLIRLVA